jgi:hypothetical protein
MSDWTNIGQDDMGEVASRALFVEDGTLGHYRHLRPGEEVETALADYASTYDCDPQEVAVRWTLYDGGEEVYSGRHTFER